MCRFQRHVGLVEVLFAAGTNISTRTKKGATPLRVAYWNGHQSVVELLLSAGATALFGTRKPIDLAKRKDHAAGVSLFSQPLPEASVATHQQRIGKSGHDWGRSTRNGGQEESPILSFFGRCIDKQCWINS